jgi:MFS family permease
VQGISMGGNLTLITMWVQEFAPKELFNQLTIFMIINLVAGQVTSFLLGTPVSVYEHWPALQRHFTVKELYYFIVFLMVSLPFIRLAYLWFHREETPIFYLKNGDNKHCRKLISDSYRAERSEEVYKEMRARANGEQSEFFNKIPSQNKKCFGKLKASWIGIYVFI